MSRRSSARAARDPSVRQIFCLGHKPAFTPADAYPDFSLDTRPRQRDRLWSAMIGARVTALITAHSHRYARRRYAAPDRPGVRDTWQIVAGHCGSQLETLWVRRVANGYFGFAVVKVTADGRAFVESYGRHYPPGQYLRPRRPSGSPRRSATRRRSRSRAPRSARGAERRAPPEAGQAAARGARGHGA